MNSEEYDEIYNFLREGTYLYSSDSLQTEKSWAKGNFRSKCNQYQIGEDDRLYKTISDSSLCLVVQEGEVNEIIKLYHDHAAHPGINTTIRKIKEKYFWIGLNKDVREYIKACHICQITAALPPKPQKKLQPIIPPQTPWTHIGIDLICDLVHNSEGYKHVLVTVCYLSKYCAVRPLKTKTSKEVLTELESIYFTLGVPKIIQHDQGPEFTSKEFQEFHRVLGIDNRSTAAYHPQSNGLVEAHNKILKMKLNKIVIQTGAEWPNKLQAATLAANTCWKRSTGYTPFYLMFGRESDCLQLLKNHNLHTADTVNYVSPQENETSEDIETLTNNRITSQKQAHQNIQSEQLIQKSIFDKKVKKNSSEIKEGDEIIYLNMPKLKHLPGTKEMAKFFGPVTALEITKSHALVKDETSLKTKTVPLHMSIPYYSGKNKRKIEAKEKIESVSKKIKMKDKSNKEDHIISWSYGISSETILSELIKFKESFSDHLTRGIFFSQLHEQLDKDVHRKGFYIPDTFLYSVLKDSSSQKMRSEFLSLLMEFAEQIFPSFGAMRANDYVFKVLYGVAMEYLNYNLLEKSIEHSQFDFQHLTDDDPNITPLTVEWQKDKCRSLNIPFVCQIEQHNTIAGQKLKYYTPARCDEIVGDGNCLFRCLSKIISGSEEFHKIVRAEICRYMVSDGIKTMGWYFKQLYHTTSLKYLVNSVILDHGIWGGDVELMAASAMLKSDIYVANRCYTTKDSQIPEIRWSRIRCSNDNSPDFFVYISNLNEHYVPVSRMMNSPTPTFTNYANLVNPTTIIN